MHVPAWSELEALFHEALAILPADRVRWLAERCADRPDLRAQVEAMLRAHDAAGAPLNASAGVAATAGRVGTRIGAYAIVGDQDSAGRVYGRR